MKIGDVKIEEIFNNLNLEIKKIIKIDTYSNFVAKVETSSGNYFFKVFTNKEESKMGLKLSKLYPLLSKKKVPVPEVLEYGESLEIIPYPYLIITEIKGKILKDEIADFKNSELKSFYYNFGKIIAEVHSITFDKFGETYDGETVEGFSEIKGKGPYGSWKEMHGEIINSRLKFLEESYFDDLIEPIRKWFESNKGLIDYDVVPRLLHDDLNQKNILIENKKISGIIDFDNAFVGHNEEELMRTETANFLNNIELKNAFFEGYEEIIPLDKGYEKRRPFYYLSRLLVHIECIVEYGKDYVKDVEKEQKSVREKIMKILKDGSMEFDKND